MCWIDSSVLRNLPNFPTVPPENQFRFENIRSFQDYFIFNDRLVLEPEKSISIRNVRVLNSFRKSPLEMEFKNKFKSTVSYVQSLLNKCLLPVKITLKIQGEEVVYQLEDNLDIFFPNGAHFIVEKSAIIIAKISDLYSLMVGTGQMHFKVDPDQTLFVVGLKKKVIQRENPLLLIFQSVSLGGFTRKEILENVSYTVESIWHNQSINDGFKIQAPNGVLEVSFSEKDDYNYSTSEFVERMILCPRMEIPKGKKLRIHGTLLGCILDAWRKHFSDKEIFGFIFNQLLLNYGIINVSGIKKDVSLDVNNHSVEIGSDSNFVIELIRLNRPVFINLGWLSVQMIDGGRQSVIIPKNQTVFLYNMSESEIQKGLINHFGIDKGKYLKKFLTKRAPVGFEWTWDCSIEDMHVRKVNPYGLVISNEKIMGWFLDMASTPSSFAASFFGNTHFSLKEAVKAGIKASHSCLIFHTILRFCSYQPEWHEDEELPYFLNEKTREEIEKTRKDEIFRFHFERIIAENLFQRLTAFSVMSLQEFEKMQPDPNESIRFIFDRIKQIASYESNGSYLRDVIRFFGRNLPMVPSEDREDGEEGPILPEWLFQLIESD